MSAMEGRPWLGLSKNEGCELAPNVFVLLEDTAFTRQERGRLIRLPILSQDESGPLKRAFPGLHPVLTDPWEAFCKRELEMGDVERLVKAYPDLADQIRSFSLPCHRKHVALTEKVVVAQSIVLATLKPLSVVASRTNGLRYATNPSFN